MSKISLERIRELEANIEKNVQNANGTWFGNSVSFHRYCWVDEDYERQEPGNFAACSADLCRVVVWLLQPCTLSVAPTPVWSTATIFDPRIWTPLRNVRSALQVLNSSEPGGRKIPLLAVGALPLLPGRPGQFVHEWEGYQQRMCACESFWFEGYRLPNRSLFVSEGRVRGRKGGAPVRPGLLHQNRFQAAHLPSHPRPDPSAAERSALPMSLSPS